MERMAEASDHARQSASALVVPKPAAPFLSMIARGGALAAALVLLADEAESEVMELQMKDEDSASAETSASRKTS